MTFKDITYTSWTLPDPLDSNPIPALKLPPSIKAILVRRGIESETDIDEFLNPKALPNPKEHYPDLTVAVERIKLAHKNNQIVAICGDYDADGMTSTALLIKTLTTLNITTIAAIPNRIEDGYGLNTNIVRNLKSKNVNVIITVDNGVSAIEAIELANELNIDVILTDHHEIKQKIPSVLSLLHPSTIPQNSPYQYLAGVGLAYVLGSSIANEFKSKQALNDSLDLFCIGTIADMAPLKGANRALLIKALLNIHNTRCEGLRALFDISNLRKRLIRTDDISFQIAPKINAVGRIGNPDLILDLLTEQDQERAIIKASECNQLNIKRRKLTSDIESEALQIIESDKEIKPFIFLAQSHWHPGIIGIVASRLVEKFQRPAALLACTKDGSFRASLRAPNGFNLIKRLSLYSNSFITFGGHAAAAGFSIKPTEVASINEKLNLEAKNWLENEGKYSCLKPDAYLSFSEINWELWNHYQKLEPFGIGNPRPIFWSRKCEIISMKILKGGHLKLILSQDSSVFEAIKWRHGTSKQIPKLIDIAFCLNINYWKDKRTFQMEIKDIRPYSKTVKISKNNRTYSCQINDDNKISIKNERNQIVSFNFDGTQLESSDVNIIESNYIDSLKNDVRVALGLLP